MNKIRFKYCLLILIFFLPAFIGAADFGLLVNNYAGYGNSAPGNSSSNETDENSMEYRGDIIPRFSFLFGDTGSFYISAGMTIGYDDDVYYIPELLRTELSMRFDAWGLSAGRFKYSDPLAFIANGLFDGIQLTHSSPAGRFGFGAWYTGFICKKNANIIMTTEDFGLYHADIEYDDFLNTYFAPARLLASIDWEHPSLGDLLRLKAAITGQADLQDNDEKYHSQYFTLKMGLPVSRFLFELGGSLETAQIEAEKSTFNLALAVDAGITWNLPASFNSRLSLTGRYASGKSDYFDAFFPITTQYCGQIFQSKITGLTVLGLNYSARLVESLGINFAASYFVRNDLIVYDTYPVSGDKDGYFLGAELFARFVWSPFSDFQFILGGGSFIPAFGDNWPDAKPVWRVDFSAVLAVY